MRQAGKPSHRTCMVSESHGYWPIENHRWAALAGSAGHHGPKLLKLPMQHTKSSIPGKRGSDSHQTPSRVSFGQAEQSQPERCLSCDVPKRCSRIARGWLLSFTSSQPYLPSRAFVPSIFWSLHRTYSSASKEGQVLTNVNLAALPHLPLWDSQVSPRGSCEGIFHKPQRLILA